ncbi:TetR/AcrR family transcriptional regulator [Paludifilum halophilum]|uniref:TetR/AcrR family transcriptional regulator n=1 Tax=Paludifilum halophilum TaxID=1642702 RepID=UPI00146AAECB|nr:TetR/AcrR family transcriptional regulator [Paludifilum halophilum]
MKRNPIDPKTSILYAAKKLFAKYGFKATTVRQICEEAHVNTAFVSYYFGGKENLFYALLDTFYPQERMLQKNKPRSSPEEELRSILEEMIRFKWDDLEMAAIIHQEIAMNSPRKEKVLQYTQPVWKRVRRILEIGRDQGIFHLRSLDHTLLVIMGAILFPGSHPIQNLLLESPSPSVDEIVTDTLNLIFKGLT